MTAHSHTQTVAADSNIVKGHSVGAPALSATLTLWKGPRSRRTATAKKYVTAHNHTLHEGCNCWQQHCKRSQCRSVGTTSNTVKGHYSTEVWLLADSNGQLLADSNGQQAKSYLSLHSVPRLGDPAVLYVGPNVHPVFLGQRVLHPLLYVFPDLLTETTQSLLV